MIEYTELTDNKRISTIAIDDSIFFYDGYRKSFKYSIRECAFHINERKIPISIPDGCVLGIKETVLLNMYQLLGSWQTSKKSLSYKRYNPFNERQYNMRIELIYEDTHTQLFFLNATMYGFHFFVDKDIITYACDGFHQHEIVKSDVSLEHYRKLLIELRSMSVRFSPKKELVMQAQNVDSCYVFCLWGSGYSDANGNSGLFLPNLAINLQENMPEGTTLVSWESIQPINENWMENAISFYSERIQHFMLEKPSNKVVLVGHSQGCLYALHLARKLTVDALILLAPQTLETCDFFDSQINLHRSNDGKDQAFLQLSHEMHKAVAIDESYYLAKLGADFYRIKSLLSLNMKEMYSSIRVPCLMLFGEKDIQITKEHFLKAIIYSKENSMLTVVEVIGMNHFLSTVTFGQVGDYSNWKPVNPIAANHIREFVKCVLLEKSYTTQDSSNPNCGIALQ